LLRQRLEQLLVMCRDLRRGRSREFHDGVLQLPQGVFCDGGGGLTVTRVAGHRALHRPAGWTNGSRSAAEPEVEN
jgi:hypothetical protein